MGKRLHVLIIGNSEDDTRLTLRELKRNGYRPIYKRVEKQNHMAKEALIRAKLKRAGQQDPQVASVYSMK